MTVEALQFGQTDLTSCDREPSHIPGSIPPHGVMLVVDCQQLVIRLYAGDTRLLLGVEPDRLPHMKLSDLFFFGLHFPAADIPPQAREMYRRNWLRLIPDVAYTPAPLMPAEADHGGPPLDMSQCVLRSVSPIHLEYLRNMGVNASMSLSIVIGNELWGLISCHHNTPRAMAADLRAACELFAQIFSLHLRAKIETEAAQRRIAPLRVQKAFAHRLPQAKDIAAELVRGQVTLLDLIPASGAATRWEGASVRHLVEEELAPFRRMKDDNFCIAGDDLMLSTGAALPFTMVVHELVSNAAKYGALSTPAGSIAIGWRQEGDDGALVLTWKERNGPPVTPPTRRGFGSVVIERGLRHHHSGRACRRAREGKRGVS